MPVPLRPTCLVLAAAVTSWAVGHALAQPGEARKPPPPFTAFPALRVPMKEDPTGTPGVFVPDLGKLFVRLCASYPRPIPGNATPLQKVRLHQLNEGITYLRRAWVRRSGLTEREFRNSDHEMLIRTAADVYRVAAELEPAAAGKVGLAEEHIAVLKAIEWHVAAGVASGQVGVEEENHVRFYRLQAEADLIQLKQGK